MELTERVNPMRVVDNDTGREYILDFNRETIAFAEDRGFTWDAVGDRIVTFVPFIWWVAFRRYNPRMARDKTDKLLEEKGGIKPKELKRLKELWDQCLAPLIADDDEAEDDAKNAKVTVVLD